MILDEFDSLMTLFYSKTMDQKRYECLFKLIELIKNASLVIIADAVMTDMGFAFITSIKDDIYYYRNLFQNKIGVSLNIFFVNSPKSKADDRIIKFCEKFKLAIESNKGLLIVSDSATIATKMRNYLSRWNADTSYFKLSPYLIYWFILIFEFFISKIRYYK